MAGLRWYEDARASRALGRRYRRAFGSVDLVNYISQGLQGMTARSAAALGWEGPPGPALVADIGSSSPFGRRLPYTARGDDGLFHAAMVGRFSRYQKRQDILIDAMAALPSDAPVRLTLIGEGERRSEMEARVAALGLGERVRFSGFVDQASLWNTLSKQQILCHCADYEGLGKTVIEAMALGVPPMVSDVPPLSDVVADGRTGFVVKENAPEAWKEALVAVAADPDRMRQVSQNAVAYCAAQYDPDRNVIAFEEAFRALLR
ncbi:MAG: glycosyltransferase [Paracoccaceae bacterium]|nr:glycosyltransferase [Paracoccaceae bacterium]